MTTTTNYGMQLPSGTDPASITPINQNTTFLDTKLKELEDVTDSVVDEIDKNTSSTSGSIVTLTDEAPLTPLKSCVCDIEPVQDLHGYDKPWVGGSGKNKVIIDATDSAITTVEDNDGNVIGIRANQGAQSYVITIKVGEVSIINGNTYTLSGSPQGYGNDTYRLDVRTHGTTNLYNNWNESNNPMITATESVLLDIYIRVAVNYALNNVLFQPQIEIGNQATSFAPYTNICPISGWSGITVTVADDHDNPTDSNTYTLTWTDAGIVYGGSIDLTSGVLRVTHKMYTFDGSDDEGWSFTDSVGVAYRQFTESSSSLNVAPICNTFEGVAKTSYGNLTNFQCAFPSGSASSYINFKTNYADITEFKSALSNTNLQVLLKLTTPLTYQLTPQTIKTLSTSPTNLWADTGDTSITYVVKDKYSNSGIPTVEAVKSYIMEMLGI